MFKIKYLYSTCAALAVLAASAATAQDTAVEPQELSATGQFLDGVAALVNDGIVLRSSLDQQIKTISERALGQQMTLPPADILEEQVLERLIVEEVQLQRAEMVGIRISDQMLNNVISNMAQQAGVAFEQMPALLEADGISYADYRAEIRRQVTIDQLRQIEVIQRIAVSPREIDQCLEDLDDNVVVNSEYNLSHILISVPDSATNAQFNDAETLANEVYQQIQDGVEFSQMAVTHSDSQTALEGGALGWLKGSDLPTLFFDVMDNLEAGQVSPPVRNVSGFHLVKINDLRSANQQSKIEQTSVRHILVSPNEIIDDATARQKLEDAKERIEAGEDFAELAKLLSDDPGSVNDGGEMGWTNPGTFVPEFEQAAQNSEIGIITEPFRTQFGWHIVEVLDRRTYDNSEDIRRNSCVSQVRNNKLASESELWVRRLRDEAFVETRI